MRFSLAAVLVLSPLVCGGIAYASAQSAQKPTDPYLDLKTVGLPAIVHGRLVNYIFAEVRLTLGRGVDGAKLQEQEPYLRDKLVRVASHTPFNPPEDGVHLDEGRLKAEVMRDAVAQFGPGKVVSVEIRSQTPERRTGVPGGA